MKLNALHAALATVGMVFGHSQEWSSQADRFAAREAFYNLTWAGYISRSVRRFEKLCKAQTGGRMSEHVEVPTHVRREWVQVSASLLSGAAILLAVALPPERQDLRCACGLAAAVILFVAAALKRGKL